MLKPNREKNYLLIAKNAIVELAATNILNEHLFSGSKNDTIVKAFNQFGFLGRLEPRIGYYRPVTPLKEPKNDDFANLADTGWGYDNEAPSLTNSINDASKAFNLELFAKLQLNILDSREIESELTKKTLILALAGRNYNRTFANKIYLENRSDWDDEFKVNFDTLTKYDIDELVGKDSLILSIKKNMHLIYPKIKTNYPKIAEILESEFDNAFTGDRISLLRFFAKVAAMVNDEINTVLKTDPAEFQKLIDEKIEPFKKAVESELKDNEGKPESYYMEMNKRTIKEFETIRRGRPYSYYISMEKRYGLDCSCEHGMMSANEMMLEELIHLLYLLPAKISR